ncbi:sensor histidine kinase [Clostridium grantii]|uniref:histidine kinase n=1 Tax=Clostridium grantii DSM 8605 TaxID=1121316 RepID=A0A1M5WWV5_9CLOT|nr:HAMP domain-containing sensor histidine kinase [Clostridium grantii]SHH92185.1 Signal transduction histidine kinase [Clostridium grantii DSM 8605]
MKWVKINMQKITFRLTMKYTLFFFITLICMSAIILFSTKYYLYNQSYQEIENVSQTIQHKLNSSKDLNNEDLNDISQMNENVDLNLRKNNEVIFSTGEIYDLKIPMDKTLKPNSLELGESNLIYLNNEFINSKNEVLYIQVIKDMDNEREFIVVLFWILIIINIVAFGVSIILGFLMSKKALQPIEKITNQAKEISVSDLTKRINIDGPDDELKRLADTFNTMISSIEYGYEKQNRFALDASHELATPLAVIKGYIDIISRWGKNNPKVLEEGIDSIKKEISNMTKLLDTLLFLAKNDNDIMKLEKNTFWLNELIIEIVKENKIIHKEIDINYDINEAALLYSDRRLIKQMMRAIIDNSIKYSKKDCRIRINSKCYGDKVEIKIKDNGIGISPEDLPNIFDRFYRVDKARTRDLGGSGLGLSIVKWIVDTHGGNIKAHSNEGEGACFFITIPTENLRV